ncbi:calcium uptake protein 2, mitochondrial-like [Dysidea avara]|uniref:calcium uptake protein 2, mitochondrial-like n=1 Tax=Dysidea avara TaxID=196820 RepID=UPI00331F2C87
MAARFARSVWTYLGKLSRSGASPTVVLIRNNNTLLKCTAVLGVSGCALIGYKLLNNRHDGMIKPFPSLVAAEENAKISRREKRYKLHASILYENECYMTPRDFVESLIKDEPRLRHGFEVIREDAVLKLLKSTPSLKRHNTLRFLRDTWNEGLLTYADYLFLLTALTKPRRQFEIAFKMMDVDGSNFIDKAEFLQVEEAVIRQRDTAHLQQHAIRNSTLIKYLFGQKGDQRLYFKDFMSFIENFQREIWEIEFHQFAKGNPTINAEDFATILLQHTAYNLESVFERLPADPDLGISFEQYRAFCELLNNLDDFGITLTIFTMANTPVTPDEFNRAVQACMGKPLDQIVVETVFKIFDVDGDGKLSNDEFLTVMKNWKLRSFKRRDAKAEGFWQDFRACIKSEIRHAAPLISTSK